MEALKILITVAWFIDSVLSSFLQVSISGVILLTEAKISRLGLWLVQVECLVALYSKRSHCTSASQYLASQHLYRLLSKTYHQSGIVRDCPKLSETVYSHLVVAFSRSKVSMRISVEQYRSRFGFHNHFVNAKDALSRFKDQFWNMMCVEPITDKGVVLRKICYNSRSQDVNSHAKIETSCNTSCNTKCN